MRQYNSAKRWLTYASRDLRSAKNSLQFEDPDIRLASFLSQQSAEKTIKAYIIFIGKRVEKTHDIQDLGRAISEFDNSFDDLLREAMSLTPYAIAARYPDINVTINLKTTNKAIDIAERVFNAFLDKIEREFEKNQGKSN